MKPSINIRRRTICWGFVMAYLLRHHKVPSAAYVRAVVEQMVLEPWANMADNIWAWAEYEQPRSMSCEITNRLRGECDERGIKYACGYRMGGKVIDSNRVTTLWDGTDEDAIKALTFEEDAYGNLFCPDALDIEQCIDAYLAGRAS